MPELPEVETVRKTLEKYIGKKIIKVDVLYKKMILSPIDDFLKNIPNTTIESIARKGKYLFINLDNSYTIISHLRMEGKYIYKRNEEIDSKHVKVNFYFDDNTKLSYEDSRCFGIMILTKTNEINNVKEIKKLGPEPFEINSPKYLYDIFKTKNIEIKACLLDQTIMCGLGNIYCDEVLFKAKINPYKKASLLNLKECENILKYSIETLNKAIELGGSTVSSYHPEKGIDGKFQNELLAYGKEKTPCPICSSLLLKDFLRGRRTTYCPKCQNVMIKIGLTGKIASGKSTVLKMFKNKGYPIFSCDDEVTKLYSTNNFKLQLINLFGDEVLNDNNTISKGYIKKIISESIESKKKLEALVHPLIKKKIIDFFAKHKDSPLTIVEVPLMFETKFNTLFDYIIGVTCSSINQINHLKIRGSKNTTQDLKLNNTSLFDKYKHKCDYLINNDGTLDDLKQQVEQILKNLNTY